MSTEITYQTHRGGIRSIAANPAGSEIGFVTSHPEAGYAGGFYRIAGDKLGTLTEVALDKGGREIVADGKEYWIVDGEGMLYQSAGKKVNYISTGFDQPLISIALLGDQSIGLLSETGLGIFDKASGAISQTIDFAIGEGNKATTIAADPTGEWIAVGYKDGSVSVFQSEDKEAFELSETEKLHEGQITALLFEPEELRFFSAGGDGKLLLTHARGKLEPEDRGRAHNHEGKITSMVLTSADRFITGSSDKTCKSWVRSGGTRPGTLKDGVIAVVDLAIATIHDRPNLVVACSDSSLRFFLLDPAGKFGHATGKVVDAYAKAKNELESSEPSVREKALKELATYDDKQSLLQISNCVANDSDSKIRLKAAEILSSSNHGLVAKQLHLLLDHHQEPVRVAAFNGLRRITGETNLQTLQIALPHQTIGAMAAKILAERSSADEQAMTLLVRSLNAELPETRMAVVESLESVYDSGSPEASLLALNSEYPDARQQAVIRMFQRNLLKDSRVQSALRRAGDDADAAVRHTAFHVSLLTSPQVAEAVRSRDVGVHRQIWELEQLDAKKKAKAPPKLKPTAIDKLKQVELRPLIEAMASRQLDTSLLGAKGLALLGDTRALGLLLQLSRETSKESRVQVCRALANLDDDRVVQRLISLLDDTDAEVRDAAYSGLDKLCKKAPLEAAEAGLSSDHVDIRSRGLKTLVDVVKKKAPKTADESSAKLLLRALNDADNKVSGEAFKVILNRRIGGDGVKSLQFILGSTQPAIRRDVLTELIGQINEPWAWDLILGLFNDPDPGIRAEAFEYALKHTKNRDPAPMAAGLDSRYPDVRLQAVEKLAKLGTKDAQSILTQAIQDEDKPTRLAALNYLVSSGAEDALLQALNSPCFDTRIRSAIALARQGNDAAYEPLYQSASEAKPHDDEEINEWEVRVSQGLIGLAELGDPRAKELGFELVASEHAKIRRCAVLLVLMVTDASDNERLELLLQNDDPKVQLRSALALALNQSDSSAAKALLSTDDIDSHLDSHEIVAGGLSLYGDMGVVPYLESNTTKTLGIAASALALLQAVSTKPEPELALAGLASRDPSVRYLSAQLVEAYASEQAIQNHILALFNEQDGWKLPLDMLLDMAAWLSSADHGRQRLRLLQKFPLLDETKPKQWQLAWNAFKDRFGPAPTLPPSPTERADLAELQDLVFGTFVGLARDVDQHETTRLLAIHHLVRLGGRDATTGATVAQTLVAFLSDHLVGIRRLAYDSLIALNADKTQLAGDCIESGQIDIGVEGLKLLSESGKGKQTQTILLEVAQTRDDELSIRAAELLAEHSSELDAGLALMDAKFPGMRGRALAWVAADYEQSKKAQKALVTGLDSKYRDVRFKSALALANFKDPVAYDALFTQLKDPGFASNRNRLIKSLKILGDPRTPSDLLNVLLADKSGQLDESLFFGAIASFRQADVAPKILPLLEQRNRAENASSCLFIISGHDQLEPTVMDHIFGDRPNDESNDFSWMDDQHPRNDQVLADLIEKLVEVKIQPNYQAFEGAKISISDAVDPVLATLTHHTDEGIRDVAVEILGWRLRFRNAPEKPLQDALHHKSPITKFLAAEGLARAGHGDGMSILLAAVELMDEVDYRVRAVEALGELGDENAVDILIKFATDEDHALQEAAIEAIGHMSKSDKADEIFAILKRMMRGEEGIVAHAIRGLRWYDTPDGWDLIRQQAKKSDYPFCYGSQIVAIDALGYNDDPATKTLLLSLFPGIYSEENLLASCRKVFGDDSLEPDIASVKAKQHEYCPEEVIDRLMERADAGQIFSFIHGVEDANARTNFQNKVLNTQPSPIDAANEVLEKSEVASTVSLAARVVGRSKKKSPVISKRLNEILEMVNHYSALNEEGKQRCDEMIQNAALKNLIWAVGQSGDEAVLTKALASIKDTVHAKVVKVELIKALAEGLGSKQSLVALEAATTDANPKVREVATDALMQLAPERGDGIGAALLSDRINFHKVIKTGGCKKINQLVQTEVSHDHYQPIVLPVLVDNSDHKPLVATATDPSLKELVRLGAIEALAAIKSETAEDELAKIGKTESIEEELRKAAWRGLRRSKRARAKV